MILNDDTLLTTVLQKQVHPQWQPIVREALKTMDRDYLLGLHEDKTWLPGMSQLLVAFSLPLKKTRYILIGESPYPRPSSANGYAFWDNAVGALWHEQGLSKEVNRATSLRNWIKMLLVARGSLSKDVSQKAIAMLDKSAFYQTANDFFMGLIKKGFLLLNASLVYRDKEVRYHARQWKSFMDSLLTQLSETNPSLQLILFGSIAKDIPQQSYFSCLISEHPYNISFIHNPHVLNFFKPLDLLNAHDECNQY